MNKPVSISASKTAQSLLNNNLTESDPDIKRAIEAELGRQQHEIELIASENIVSQAVMEAQGSVIRRSGS